MNTEVINPETGEVLEASKPKLSKKERYLVRLAELLEEARNAGLEAKKINEFSIQIEISTTEDRLTLIGKHLVETIKALNEAKKKWHLEPIRLYYIKGKDKQDGTTEICKEFVKTLPALEECRQKEGCYRLTLNCPLFPLANSKSQFSGFCSERLPKIDLEPKKSKKKKAENNPDTDEVTLAH